MTRVVIRFALAAATGLVAVAGPPAQAASGLSVRSAAAAITRQAERDGGRNVTVDACRRTSPRRVVCSIHVTRANGARELDRYVAFRGASGRIGVGHRPILPPAVGH